MTFRTAIVLCGGKGTRLGELGKKYPKTLIKAQNRPILWYILKTLKKNGFNHLILPVGYKGEQIKNFLNKLKLKKCKVDIIDTGLNTTIAKRIFKVKKFIKSDNFIILNGDAIFRTNLNKIFNNHVIKKNDVSFICCETEADFGTVGVIDNRVVNFERSLSFKSVNNNIKNFKAYVYSGMAIFNLKILKENFKNYLNFEKNFYPRIIKKFKIDFQILKGFWYAVDNVKNLETLNRKKNNRKIFNNIYELKKKLND